MKIMAPVNGRYLGVFASSSAVREANAFQTASQTNPAIVHVHLDWKSDGADGSGQLIDFNSYNNDFGASISEVAAEMALNNRILAISWDPMSIEAEDPGYYDATLKPRITLSEILNGSLDTFIRTFAQQVAALDLPVMMTLFGESNAMALFGYGANGTSFGESLVDRTGKYGDPNAEDGAERVRDAFRHVIDIFREEGADNVSWYQYMSTGLMTEADSIHPSEFYAGDDYIDWVGQSVYVATPDDLGASLDAGYAAWAEVTDKPFFIPEFGLTQQGASDDLARLLDGVAAYDRVKAVTITDFEAAETQYNVPRLGSRSGDWDAIENSAGYLDQIILEDAGNAPVMLSAWRDVTSASNGSALLLGTSGNDLLISTAGIDQMHGGNGDDVYMVDQTDDSVVELAFGGDDLVVASVSFTLSDNVESLTLDGSANISGTGNAANNTLTGNSGNNRLTGLGGADTLDGGTGADTLDGGTGDDMFIVNSTSDVIIERSGQGQDQVVSTVSYTLPDFVELLTLGGTGAINGTGNSLANSINGNAAANRISGGSGNDTLLGEGGSDPLYGDAGDDYLAGGSGSDTLWGGSGADYLDGGSSADRLVIADGADIALGGTGADTFEFRATGALAMVLDFTPGTDSLDMKAFNIASMTAFQSMLTEYAGSTLIAASGNSALYLQDVPIADLLASTILL